MNLRILLGIAAAMALLAGCGEGGGGGTASSATLSGVAAAGAPIVGTVTVKDSSSPAQTKTVAIAPDGSYTIDVAGMKDPFVLRATSTVGGRTYNIHSGAVSSDIGGRINITPLTDLIIANVAGQLAENYFNSGNFGTLTAAELAAAETTLRTRLQPLLAAVGVNASVDLLRSAFSANGTGLDGALDALRVTIDPATATAVIRNAITNQQITDNLASKTDATVLPATNVTPTTLTELQQVIAVFDRLSKLFATSLPAANATALLAVFDPGFVYDGANLTSFLTELTSDPTNIGFRATDIVMLSSDLTATIPSMNVRFISYEVAEMRLNKVNGSWLIAGNRKVARAQPETFARQQHTGAIDTGVLFNIRDAPAPLGLSYAIVKGKGLPTAGALLVNYQNGGLFEAAQAPYNGTATARVSNQGDGGIGQYPLADSVIASIADDEAYTIELWKDNGTPSNLADDVQVASYTQKLNRRPYLSSELSAASFATISTTPTAIGNFARSGGTLTVNWSVPAGTTSGGLHLFRNGAFRGSGPSEGDSLSVDFAGTATSTTVTLAAPSFSVRVSGVNLSVTDVFYRELKTIVNGQ